MQSYTFVFVLPWCLVALAVLVAVIRAPKEHLREIVCAIMGRKDDDGDGPPSLPKP